MPDTIFILTPSDILGAIGLLLFWLFCAVCSLVFFGTRIAAWWKRRAARGGHR